MIRTALASAALVATLLAPATARAQATAADAAPFLGDWTLALQGPNGPATFNLSVKVEDDKVVGEIASFRPEVGWHTGICRKPAINRSRPRAPVRKKASAP